MITRNAIHKDIIIDDKTLSIIKINEITTFVLDGSISFNNNELTHLIEILQDEFVNQKVFSVNFTT